MTIVYAYIFAIYLINICEIWLSVECWPHQYEALSSLPSTEGEEGAQTPFQNGIGDRPRETCVTQDPMILLQGWGKRGQLWSK